MAKRKYKLAAKDQALVDEFVLRIGGSEAGREVLRSLVEIIVGDIGKPVSKVKDLDVLKERDNILSSDYSSDYKRKLIFNLKRFFVWYWGKAKVTGNDISGVVLPKADWKTKDADDILTPEEIELLIKACHNTRDRCFVSMLWDGSNRPVELISLKWGNLKSDDHGYYFKTSAKTGKERHIRLTTSTPYIEAWRLDYPDGAADDKPLFCNLRRDKKSGKYKPMTVDSVQFMFETIRNETGIKRFKPSVIRPSRITDDINNNYPETYVKMKNWGNLKTPMIDKYTHLRPDYVDGIALEKAGIKRETVVKKTHKIDVPTCPSCGTLNVPGREFCTVCHAPMTEAAKTEYKNLQQEVQDLRTLVGDLVVLLKGDGTTSATIEKIDVRKLKPAVGE